MEKPEKVGAHPLTPRGLLLVQEWAIDRGTPGSRGPAAQTLEPFGSPTGLHDGFLVSLMAKDPEDQSGLGSQFWVMDNTSPDLRY